MKDVITMSGIVKITKMENNKETGYFVIKNKINNNMRIALGDLICKSIHINREYNYISEMRIYGVTNSSELNGVLAPTANDGFPTRSYISKVLGTTLTATSNVIDGTNLFSAIVYNDDDLASSNTFYISDIVLVGKRGSNNLEVWSRVLAPSDGSSGEIGLLKTPSVSYRIDWYIIFNQE